MKTKIIILVSILTLMVLSGCNYLKEESYDLDSCIKEKREKFGDKEPGINYDKGVIGVIFKEGLTDEEVVRGIIESRDLTIRNMHFSDSQGRTKGIFYPTIAVPVGSELKWVCIFENEEPLVNYSSITNGGERNSIIVACQNDNDCGWGSTNNCPESSGAYWECINLKESSLSFPEDSSCYLFFSPKPKARCYCSNNQCFIENNEQNKI